MNTKIDMLINCVESIKYWLLHNLHNYTFYLNEKNEHNVIHKK